MKKSLTLILTITLFCLLSMGAVVSAATPGYPILVTSAGQSADDMILKVMLERQLGNSVEREQMAQPANVKGKETLILVVGVSNKGLGAAGINLDQEKARISSLLEAAKAEDCYVIMVHIGGPSRRGAGSDEVAKLVAPYAHSIIVLAEGNQDGLFDELAAKTGASFHQVEARNDVATIIAGLMK